MDGLEYTFTDSIKIWQGGKSTWHYVSLPMPVSEEVRTLCQYHQTRRRGWGAVRVSAQVGAVSWQTSIFPAFEHQQYQLFLKAGYPQTGKHRRRRSDHCAFAVAFRGCRVSCDCQCNDIQCNGIMPCATMRI